MVSVTRPDGIESCIPLLFYCNFFIFEFVPQIEVTANMGSAESLLFEPAIRVKATVDEAWIGTFSGMCWQSVGSLI